jgi:two-component system, cell cycle sensor histidine kinase and response regulator CckA
MGYLRDLPVRKKVLWSNLLASVTVLALAVGGVVLHERLTVRERVERELHSLSEVIAVSVRVAIAFNDDDTVEETLRALEGNPAVLSARVSNAQGREVARYERARQGAGASRFTFRRPLLHQGQRFADIELAADPDVVLGLRLRGHLSILVLAALALAAGTWFFSSVLKRTLADPLTALARTARRVAEEKDYDARSGHRGADEVGQLAAVFDEMLATIAERDRAQRRLIAILDATPDLVAIADGDGKPLYLNRAGRAMLGLSEEDPLSALVREAGTEAGGEARAGPDARPTLFSEEAIRSATERGVWSGETVLAARTGVETAVSQVVLAHRDREGRVEYVSTICRNITEQRRAAEHRAQLEEQLRQAQKMEAVGQLAGGIAHDFNNLLTSIQGYTELARDAGARDTVREYLGYVLDAVGRSQQLSRQLLTFGRRQMLDLRVLDLRAHLGSAAGVLRRLIRESVQLEIRAGDVPLPVRADATQLDQVLINLALNAQDAMPAGGTLTIEATSVTLEGATLAAEAPGLDPGAYAVVSVTDTGTGMDLKTKTRVFEPFFTTKPRGKGTGLGLSTAHGIVKQHGGAIAVRSALGQGSTFSVYLPLSAEAPDMPGPPSLERPRARGAETILVVEDEADVRSLACRVLSLHGYKVLEAPDAASCLRIGATCPEEIHLLVTDVVMPVMNGRDVADALLRLRPGLRVLFMSGYSDGILAEQALDAAKIDFIRKPFSVEALTEAVRAVLDGPPRAGV